LGALAGSRAAENKDDGDLVLLEDVLAGGEEGGHVGESGGSHGE